MKNILVGVLLLCGITMLGRGFVLNDVELHLSLCWFKKQKQSWECVLNLCQLKKQCSDDILAKAISIATPRERKIAIDSFFGSYGGSIIDPKGSTTNAQAIINKIKQLVGTWRRDKRCYGSRGVFSGLPHKVQDLAVNEAAGVSSEEGLRNYLISCLRWVK